MKYLRIEEAAEQLGLTPKALRARCLRATKGGRRAELAPGIEAVKLGRSWRIVFAEGRAA